jgi:hypothetical protein
MTRNKVIFTSGNAKKAGLYAIKGEQVIDLIIMRLTTAN